MSENIKKDMTATTATVRELALILNETDLAEIEYEQDECRIRVVKHQKAPMGSCIAPDVRSAPMPALSAAPQPSIPPLQHPGLVKAPIVGTVYLSPQPNAAPFIKEGSPISEGDTLLIIEAMKVMNPIRAPKSGCVKSILVSNGEPVEYDHGLIIIE